MHLDILRRGNRQAGFSIVELLVCVAIIGILLALYSSSLSKAMRAAKGVAAGEAMHQTQISKAAEAQSDEPPTKEDARYAFRQELDTGKGEAIMTEVLFIVRSDAEFKAYWNTLINEENEDELAFTSSGSLVAATKSGSEYTLPPVGANDGKGGYAIGWEFLSTVLSETGTGTLGANVMYSDGHIDFVKYPGAFPMTAAVAKFSHKFMEQSNT